ncbi:eukaryotic translation initiation factor eIF2A-domain-containing protein [Chytridium lagenaria]|nr:eukaryotic translation initiation factor eIF2A-domain-containing protein [Chytridium lagenaria]
MRGLKEQQPAYSFPGDILEMNEEDIDYTDIEEHYRVQMPSGFESIVVIDGIPVFEESKQDRFIDFLKTKLKNMGTVKSAYVPFNSQKNNKGYIFVEFETPEQANLCVKATVDGLVLDKKHTAFVNRFDDIDHYLGLEEEYIPPVIEAFREKEHLRSWLLDEKSRDQWAEQPDMVHSRGNWSDMYVSWSPQGTYLATFHKQGVVLWGGPSFSKMVRFAHTNVKLLDFSPDERYIITWSNEPIVTATGDHHHVIVWDVQSGRQLRSFPVDPSTHQVSDAKSIPGSSVKIDWPLYKWSHDSKYFARMTPGANGMISVYETPTLGLLDKKSIKIENVQSFDWSPTENIISYWTPEAEDGNIPARVTLMRIPSREIVRTKNMVNVISASLHWQSAGDFLLVRVERAKTKKQAVTNFEVLRLKEKGIPVEVVELKPGESVTNVFWEPKGDRFAVITSESSRIFVHFYQVLTTLPLAPTKKGIAPTELAPVGIKLLRSLERKGINQVIWSPKGRIAVLAGIRAFQGELEFWDVEEGFILGQGEHYMCTDLEWDPTGRYVMSSVSWWRVQTDSGFILWSMTGQPLAKQPVPQFKQILWRPRPATPLPLEEQKKIKKNLKEHSKEFDEADAKLSTKATEEVSRKRKELWREWVDYRNRCNSDWVKEAELRNEIVGFDLEEDARSMEAKEVEEYIDEVVDEVEEIVEDEDDD